MEKYIMLNKAVGETPLSCAEAYRAEHPELTGVSMAYAGRLDPMASGKLLVLLGDECKNQTAYHSLDKEYEFSVLLGIGSDSHDVLGRLHTATEARPQLKLEVVSEKLTAAANNLVGDIQLPYPHFSAKTVQGMPLHMWTLQGRLDEIEIPTKESTIYDLALESVQQKSRADVCAQARTKIDSIPEVTEERKALGNDFRRVDVRADWERINQDETLPTEYQIAHFTCTASSGTYMRTLAHLIGQRLHIPALAWSIHRTRIGTFDATTRTWSSEFS
jgi:tRNA pseudouridine(55) synthase